MTTPYAELAVLERGGLIESKHYGSLVALGATGDIVAVLGAAREPMWPRSTVKPIQALACLQAGAPLTGAALAMAAASHTGEDGHVETIRAMLAASDLDESALQCPPDVPEDRNTRRRLAQDGAGPQRIRMNCSGKHAAMLVACVAAGWPTDSYLDPGHPLQQKIELLLAERAGEPIAARSVDGCGAPLLAVSLVGLATAVRSVIASEPGTPDRALADAMRAHPFYVAGTGQANTVLMERLPGTVFKRGAEGVIVAVCASGRAVAAKSIDGSSRATTTMALAALEAMGENVDAAADLRTTPVFGGGRPVGEIRASAAIHDAVRAGAAPPS